MVNLAEVILGVIGALVGIGGGAAIGYSIGGQAFALIFMVIGGLAVGWIGKNAHRVEIGMQ
jgi:uncharacterized membrane protein YeaQ/YmgE (transglycosylase-associated protein family)